MILIKYALLLFALCSVVVPQGGNSGQKGKSKGGKKVASDSSKNRGNSARNDYSNSPKPISFDKLVALNKTIINRKPMPSWPPSDHIGAVYMTEPMNMVSIELFSTWMS